MSETKLIAISGFEQVGSNMVAIKSGRDIIVIDCGLDISYAMLYEDPKNLLKETAQKLLEYGAMPDYHILERIAGKIRAFIFSHAHLDHIGAFPKICENYKESFIVGTPYTIYTLLHILRDNKIDWPKNQVVTLSAGESFPAGPSIGIGFINMTHSVPQTVSIAVHTANKTIVYISDFKLDNGSKFGPPDYERLRRLGNEGVDLLLIETTRAHQLGHTPSEKVAEMMLKDVLSLVEDKNGLILTTYSSHIERIEEITNIVAEKLGRTPVIIGRSLARSVELAEKLGLIKLPEGTRIVQNVDEAVDFIKELAEKKQDYALLVTGHQGEPDAVLTRIADNQLPYKITPEDCVIFSSDVIPHPINRANHWRVVTKLKRMGASVFLNVHVSGHGMSEDHKRIINMLNPEQIIPIHGEPEGIMGLVKVAEEEGYLLNDDLHILRNGQEFILE
ncbi:MAG: MBL fold metallo-hydrolase [bacterium]|nr:MBL fold metallo-hydrolase [bacterium]